MSNWYVTWIYETNSSTWFAEDKCDYSGINPACTVVTSLFKTSAKIITSFHLLLQDVSKLVNTMLGVNFWPSVAKEAILLCVSIWNHCGQHDRTVLLISWTFYGWYLRYVAPFHIMTTGEKTCSICRPKLDPTTEWRICAKRFARQYM